MLKHYGIAWLLRRYHKLRRYKVPKEGKSFDLSPCHLLPNVLWGEGEEEEGEEEEGEGELAASIRARGAHEVGGHGHTYSNVSGFCSLHLPR